MVFFHMTTLELPNCFSNIVVNRPYECYSILKLNPSLGPCFQLSSTGKLLQPSSLSQYAATNSSVSPRLVHEFSSILKNRDVGWSVATHAERPTPKLDEITPSNSVRCSWNSTFNLPSIYAMQSLMH